jgi:hemolysin activation/secretion protein
VLSLQYTTTAEKPERVSVYGVGYHMPIYALADSLDLYANYSDVDSGSILAGIFDLQVSGKGTVFGTRYNHSFGRVGAFDSTVSLGLDYKAYRNGLTFQGFELGNDVTVHPVSLAYGGTWKTDASTTAFIVTGIRNVPGGDRGSQDDFDRVRFNAPANYTLVRYGVAHMHSLPADWQVRIAAAGQYTRDALVPGEQFGAGGMTSVRGFLSREVAGDKGISGSAEIYTPDLCGRWPGAAVFCRVLAFYDAARISRNDILPGESAHASIGSIGAGVRAAMGRYVTLALDVGHVIDSGPVDTKGHNRVNFKLSLSY